MDEYLSGLIIGGIAGAVLAMMATGFIVDDTKDRALERCIVTCRDTVQTYSPNECVCKDGTRLETKAAP